MRFCGATYSGQTRHLPIREYADRRPVLVFLRHPEDRRAREQGRVAVGSLTIEFPCMSGLRELVGPVFGFLGF